MLVREFGIIYNHYNSIIAAILLTFLVDFYVHRIDNQITIIITIIINHSSDVGPTTHFTATNTGMLEMCQYRLFFFGI